MKNAQEYVSQRGDRVWDWFHRCKRKLSAYSFHLVTYADLPGGRIPSYTKNVAAAEAARELFDFYTERKLEPEITLQRKILSTREFQLTPKDMEELTAGIDPHDFLEAQKLRRRLGKLYLKSDNEKGPVVL